jgi:DNA polymerase III subunit delta'
MAEGDSPPHPRANPDLVGHEAAEAELLSAHARGRLAHGWLLAGPRGVGKATLAYRFARYVLKQGRGGGSDLFGSPPASLYVPPEDPVFRRVASGGHADLLSLERQPNERGTLYTVIRVEQVRALGGFFALTSAEGGWRVAVIDSADELGPESANALLKVLEEPPPRSLLLLVAHAPSRLLPTVRSRCRRLTLRPLSEAGAADVVGRHRPDLSPEERLALARLAEGSPGRALALAEQGGLALYQELVRLLGGLPHLPPLEMHALADRLARREQEAAYRTWLDLLGLWLGRVVRAGAGRADVEAAAGEGAAAAVMLALATPDRWAAAWEEIARLAARTDAVNLDRKQMVLSALLALEKAARG